MRAYNRLQTNQTIDFETDGRRETAQIYNLSCGGCMIEAASSNLTDGDGIEIFLGPQMSLAGTVAWLFGNNIGIKFLLPLHQSVVEAFRFPKEDADFDTDDRRDRFGLPLIAINRAAIQ